MSILWVAEYIFVDKQSGYALEIFNMYIFIDNQSRP